MSAVVLGVTIALAMVGTALAIIYPPLVLDLLPDRSVGTQVPLSNPPPEEDCSDASGSMHLDSSAFGQRLEPLLKAVISRGGKTYRAEFSGHWSWKRIVVVDVNEPWVTVRASFHTDIGDTRLSVEVATSGLHMHADKVCFDLSVSGSDGKPFRERWIGQIPLR